MATQFKHSYKEFGADAIRKRVQSMLEFRNEVNVTEAHVKFSYDNRKTGALVPSVSLIPVADCGNCAVCAKGCYDVRNVCFQKTVQKSRANNSAILREDPGKYWREIEQRISCLRFFRFHVGGDIKDYSYFVNMVGIAVRNPHCEILAFTKMYDIVKIPTQGGFHYSIVAEVTDDYVSCFPTTTASRRDLENMGCRSLSLTDSGLSRFQGIRLTSSEVKIPIDIPRKSYKGSVADNAFIKKALSRMMATA